MTVYIVDVMYFFRICLSSRYVVALFITMQFGMLMLAWNSAYAGSVHAIENTTLVHGAQNNERAEPSAKPTDEAVVIYMALYRGITSAERGFMDYLQASKLNVRFVVRDAAGDSDTLEMMRTEIRELSPDLVYAFGTTVAVALAGTLDDRNPEHHVTDHPVLFNIVADPIGARLIESFQDSGGNLTGTTHAVPMEIQYRTLRRALSFTRLGVIYNPMEVNSRLTLLVLKELVEADGDTLILAPVAVQSVPEIDAANVDHAIRELIAANVQVVYLPSDSTVIGHTRNITALTNANGIPTFSATEDPVRNGGAVMGLTSRYYNVGQFAAYKAEQILRGVQAQDIPIESLDRFSFVVNVAAALATDGLPPLDLLRIGELLQSDLLP